MRWVIDPERACDTKDGAQKASDTMRVGMDHDEEPLRIPISDVFDLHTIRPQDVQEAVEAYLEEANRLGLKALRIIHGRGIGVQREIVRAVLARTPFVLSFQDAPLEAGGWGATIVTLR
jgi:dsDNA-specific endonuclease/ATPase MutS2